MRPLPIALFLAAGSLVAPMARAQGQPYEWVGVQSLPTAVLEQAIRALPSDSVPQRRRQVADAVEGAYRKEGYSLARVLTIDEQSGRTIVTVAEGRIRKLVVTGNSRSKIATLERVLQLGPGEVWREQVATQDRERLARLGIFDDVLLSARVPDESENADVGVVDLVVKVKEAQTGNVAATVGYGDGTGFIGFVSLSDNNFLGSGDKVRLDWQRWARIVLQSDGTYAQDSARQAFQFGYGRPPGRRGQIAWDVAVYDQNTIFLPTFNANLETIRNYERRKGGSLRVGGAVASQLNLFGTVRADRVGYDPLPDRLGVPQSEWQGANARIGAFGMQAEWDRRNKADYPNRGFFIQGNWEQAGTAFGGERSFRKLTADLRRYQPIDIPRKPGSTFATRLMAGNATGSLPLSEQFFLGGFDLLRGYDLFSIRGDRMALASAELRVPVGPGLVGVMFVDHGAAWLPGTAAGSGGWRTGYGVGLRFASPVGPLRLDFAQGSRLQTYVSLGQAF